MTTLNKSIENEWFKPRLAGAFLVVLIAFSVVFVRLFSLQIINGEEYRRLSENNCIRLEAVSGLRGVIHDRKGVLLVDNRPAFDLKIVPEDARPVRETLRKLSRFTGLPETELHRAVEASGKGRPYRPVVLLSDIDRDLVAVVETHRFDLPGVVIDVQAKRHYLQACAAHLIGYLGEINVDELNSGRYAGSRSGDLIGKSGVEKIAENMLRGASGGRLLEVNAQGRVVKVLKTVPSRPGNDLWLTIDHRLQKLAETLLEGLDGGIVALDPKNGEVLALASSPAFDSNAFVDGMSSDEWNALLTNPGNPLENKIVQGEYPPASTYKVVTAMAGLEEGVIDENTEFFCPGSYRLGNRTFHCWRKGGHGRVNVVEALAVSCDVFFYQLGQRLGVDRIAQYANACGLGKPTGIQLNYEAAGLIPTSAWKKRTKGISWQRGETLSVAIGQGYNLVTPLQIAVLYAGIANGGTLFKPNLFKEIRNPDTGERWGFDPEITGRLPASAATLRLIQNGLWDVVNGPRGTARLARLEGFEVSGKTGTAQVFSRKKPADAQKEETVDHLKPHAWFVAYAQSNERRIAVSVLVEHGEHGSSAAAPLAREMIAAYLADPSRPPAHGDRHAALE